MSNWRRTSKLILTLALALTTLAGDAVFSQGGPPARRTVMLDGREVVEGEVLVRYRSDAGAIERQRAEFQAHSDSSESIGRRGARRMRSRQLSTREMLAAMRANPDVEVAEPNYIIRAHAQPNDPSLGALWGLINTGQTVEGQPGVAGADIGAERAWDVTTGSRANVVAIIDTGIDFTHPDLAANAFVAPRQFSVTVGSATITCAAGTHGFNALTNTCLPLDDNGHGTHVAGIVGAVGNNGVGVTGVNWTANLMAVKVLGADGAGTTSDAINGIEFIIKAKAALGAEANVRVLNASWGNSFFSQLLSEQIQAASQADMLLVAAAGSARNNNDAVPHYPASYAIANVLSVTATDNRGGLESSSNYGASSVHLAAPGGGTYSTFPGNTYRELAGTSMSAPFVAGAAALMLARCPMSTGSLKATLLSTVTPVGSLAATTVSGGRLNAGAALQHCVNNPPAIAATPANPAAGASLSANITNGPGFASDWAGLFAVGATASQALQWQYLNGSTTTQPSSGITNATLQFTAPSTNGNYEIRLYGRGYALFATSGAITVGGPALPKLRINDVSVTEGASGTTTATFSVTLAPSSSQTVTVNYATTDGTATTANNDYVAATGTLSFAPSDTTRTFTVTVNGDTVSEPTETFTVTLSGAVNATIEKAQGIGTIVTDEGPPSPTLTPSSTSVPPGSTFQVTLNNGPGNTTDWAGLFAVGAADTQAIQWQYLNGSTTTQPSSGISTATLQFVAPSTNGNYEIRLYGRGYARFATSPTISVATLPRLSINDVSVTEGNSGTTTATFTVTLTPASSQTVTVNYATADGTGTTVNSDYVASNGTLSFAPSATSRTISVTINGDTVAEPNETFTVNLSMAVNAATDKAQGVGTIVTDDGAPSPMLTPSATTVTPGSTFQVTLSNGPANTTDWVGLFAVGAADWQSLQWQYLNGSTATQPSSGIANATLQFTAPATNGSYEIRLYGKGYARFATSPTITVGTAPAQPKLSINDLSVVEGNSGTTTATFTVTLIPSSSQTVTVNYATADGTATTANNDYVAASGTLTFAPSVTTRTFTVTINGDTVTEPTETFTVALSGAVNATIDRAQGVGTILNDDGTTSPSLTPGSTSPTPGSALPVTLNNGPGNTTDWIGLFAVGAADSQAMQWQYLNGSTSTLPSSGITSTTLQFVAPSANGNYEFRLYGRGYARFATSSVITVSGGSSSTSPSVTPASSSVTRGATIQFAVSNAPADPRNWVGLFVVGASDSSAVQWQYLNGSTTQPSTGISNANLQFVAPSTTGSYEIRLYAPGYAKLATSTTITVTP